MVTPPTRVLARASYHPARVPSTCYPRWPMRLGREFYARPTLEVARNLLGKYLVRRVGRTRWEGRIVETEAYCGPDDLACHASRGLTRRTAPLFERPGTAYVYLIYGMYHCL